jgi:hypothetical protein
MLLELPDLREFSPFKRRFFMKTVLLNYTKFLSALFVLAVISAGAIPISAQSANGQGTLLVLDDEGNTVRRTFSFSARTDRDGNVRGNAVLHNPAFDGASGNQPYMLHINVSCLKVDGNIAYMGGTVRRTTDPTLVDAVFFAVQDNGQPGAGSDMMSTVFFWDEDPTTTGDPQTCQLLPDPTGPSPIHVIEAGNIRVAQ